MLVAVCEGQRGEACGVGCCAGLHARLKTTYRVSQPRSARLVLLCIGTLRRHRTDETCSAGHKLIVSMPSARLVCRRERVVAVESLSAVAAELRGAKAALVAALSQHGAGASSSGAGAHSAAQREVDTYFNRTVEAVEDLRECVFKGAARLLLQVGRWRLVATQAVMNGVLLSLSHCLCACSAHC